MQNPTRFLPFFLVPAALACAAPLGAGASEPGPQPSCMEVEVNGQRAPSFECLTQKLQPTPAPGNAQGNGEMRSAAIANRPSNELGLFNYSATSHRMGNQFGVSVHPQRPPEERFVLPFGPRR